jgi:YHYH protein
MRLGAGLVAATGVLAACAGLLVACSSTAADGLAAATASTTPSASFGVACDYRHNGQNRSPSVNAVSLAQWRCQGASRMLTANGIPDHEVGTFPNADNPNRIREQAVSATFPLAPVATGVATGLGGPRGAVGFILNGVKIDPGTNGGCNDDGSVCDPGRPAGRWRMEALGQSSFRFGTDSSNAHVQPDGSYHYHGMPEGFIALQGKGRAMTLIGWAADGFPIYARYGYAQAADAASGIKLMQASYRLKISADADRPPVAAYPLGAFEQDYEYVAGLGDLDECNGRNGVTPEFPSGTYHYYATDSYPYLQRCVKGAVSGGRQGGGARPTAQALDACRELTQGQACAFADARSAAEGPQSRRR